MKALQIGDQQEGNIKQQRLISYLRNTLLARGISITMQAEHPVLNPDIVLITGTPDTAAVVLLSQLAPQVPVLLFVADHDFHISLPVGTNITYVFYVDSLPKGYADYPKEMTAVIHIPGARCADVVPAAVGNRDALCIAFINCQDNLYASRQLLAVFNDLSGHDCRVFEHGRHLGLLQEHANHHVRLHSLDEYLSNLPDFDLVIANGQAAVDAILHHKPLIVAGLNGFAGMVNEKNLAAHIKCHFSGRIGGYIGERIPVTMVIAELLAVNTLMREGLPLKELAATTAIAYHEPTTTDIIMTRIIQLMDTAECVYGAAETLLPLVPQIATNIVFDQRQGEMIMKRLGSMKVLNGFTDEERLLLTFFDGSKSLQELVQMTGLEDSLDVVLSFVRYCFENKIIFFTNGTGHDRLPREAAVNEQF